MNTESIDYDLLAAKIAERLDENYIAEIIVNKLADRFPLGESEVLECEAIDTDEIAKAVAERLARAFRDLVVDIAGDIQ